MLIPLIRKKSTNGEAIIKNHLTDHIFTIQIFRGQTERKKDAPVLLDPQLHFYPRAKERLLPTSPRFCITLFIFEN